MADITTPVLNLKSLEIDETGDSGVNIHLSGVAPGIINSILRLMKITGTTDLRMNASYLELRSGSASGQRSWFVPTGSLSSVQGGYRKDISAIFIGILLFFASLIILSATNPFPLALTKGALLTRLSYFKDTAERTRLLILSIMWLSQLIVYHH